MDTELGKLVQGRYTGLGTGYRHTTHRHKLKTPFRGGILNGADKVHWLISNDTGDYSITQALL